MGKKVVVSKSPMSLGLSTPRIGKFYTDHSGNITAFDRQGNLIRLNRAERKILRNYVEEKQK